MAFTISCSDDKDDGGAGGGDGWLSCEDKFESESNACSQLISSSEQINCQINVAEKVDICTCNGIDPNLCAAHYHATGCIGD